jgi:hypothetical protein
VAVGRVGDRAAGGEGAAARRRPGHRPMLRSRSPALVRQELAAWAAVTGLTRGVVRDAALAAVPAGKGAAPGSRSGPGTCPMPAPSGRFCPRSGSGTTATRP